MITVAALYHFARIPDPPAVKGPLASVACGAGIKGSLLIAPEGINGTIAGSRAAIDAVIAHIRSIDGFDGLEWKESTATEPPFNKLKVRLKKEIVTMGAPGLDPGTVGTHVEAADWNALITAPDVAVIDTRNDYEVAIGSFEGAVDPQTASFREFPEWWAQNRNRFEGKRIAMFCTGGIRCEKSTAYLKSQGVEDVFHLKGGILKYLEEVPETDSLWQGGCFVFDERVAVGHGLTETDHVLCRACRRPLGPEDLRRPQFELGVSCHLCIDEHTEADRTRFRERQKQISLAKLRGDRHLG